MNSWEFLHRWYMPFLWLTLAWLIAVPAAIYFQSGLQAHHGSEIGLPYGDDWVLRDDYLATIVIYLLNLGAAIWLFSSEGSTRWAAFWAALLGLARIALPITLTSLSDVTVAGNQHYIDWGTLRYVLWFQDIQMFLLGLMMWSVFARFVGETGGSGAQEAHYAGA